MSCSRVAAASVALAITAAPAAAKEPSALLELGKCHAWFSAVRAAAEAAPIPDAPANVSDLLEQTIEVHAAAATMVLNGPGRDAATFFRGQKIGAGTAWLEIDLGAIDYKKVRSNARDCIAAIRAAGADFEDAMLDDMKRRLGIQD